MQIDCVVVAYEKKSVRLDRWHMFEKSDFTRDIVSAAAVAYGACR